MDSTRHLRRRHAQAAVLYQKGLLESDSVPEVHMRAPRIWWGSTASNQGEDERLAQALERSAAWWSCSIIFSRDAGGVQVRVGLEEAHPAMKELALIGVTLALSQRAHGGRLPCSVPMAHAVRKGDGAGCTIGREFSDVG